MIELRERIYASLAGSLLGDAMGSVTEQLTRNEVAERYGRVTTLLAAGEGTFASGRRVGALTDDGWLTYRVAEAIVAKKGYLHPSDVADILLIWTESTEMFTRFTGPSSRKAIQLLKEGADPAVAGAPHPLDNDLRNTNGAAMKASPAGLVTPGDTRRAAQLATVIAMPTHNSDIAFSGAAAVAAAVATALSGASAHEVVLGAISGAEYGLAEARGVAIPVPGPSISKRIQLALKIAESDGNQHKRAQELFDVIGCGLPIAEAVPTAIGLFRVFAGDPAAAIEEAVNNGDDSDTVASITGAIAGAYSGSQGLNPGMISLLEQENALDLGNLADELATLAKRGVSHD